MTSNTIKKTVSNVIAAGAAGAVICAIAYSKTISRANPAENATRACVADCIRKLVFPDNGDR